MTFNGVEAVSLSNKIKYDQVRLGWNVLMKMTELRDKAKGLGLRPGKMKKTELVRAIQKQEGFSDCYGRSCGACQNVGCSFISDCLKVRI